METVFISILFVATASILAVMLIKKRKREKLNEMLSNIEADVADALAHQKSLLDFKSGYLMKKDWDVALESSRSLFKGLQSIPKEAIDVHSKRDMFEEFIKNHSDLNLREIRNAEYEDAELQACDGMLSNIDGKSLDTQQRTAIVVDEYNNLIIAGAGSGKTLTVVGKIKYLVERRGVRPEDILVTSFTRKSVNELDERIRNAGIDNVSCKTFHKIGLERLGKIGVANENELRNCVKHYLCEEILKHSDQMSAYIEFYGCYKHIPKDYSEYKNDGERMESLKATNLETIKGRLDTIKGERVKSLEELMIANFLFLHGVSYEYERNYSGNYETNGRAYQPDFYLCDYDIWLEHFGVDEYGRCPWMASSIEERKYIEDMEWKRGVHTNNGTRLIESYSYWNKNHGFLNNISKLLEGSGVKLVKDHKILADVYERLAVDDKNIKDAVSLISTFLSLAKANNISMDEAVEYGRKAFKGDGFMWHRFKLFMTFTKPVLNIYKQTLAIKEQVDFDDMINAASAKIAAEGISENYDYIIVDEYQDISKSRFELIKAIREKCNAKLICVGDDWQSIYRFAGSDISLFTEFEKSVGYCKTMKIERTYRNSQELVDVASAFIERNSAQIHKEMRSEKHEKIPIIVSFDGNMASGLERSLANIVKKRKGVAGSVLVLGRHNFDIETAYPDFRKRDSYSNDHISLKRDRITGDVHISFRGINDITFMSVHRAKGLEADDVIVLDLINDMYGFPNRVEDDPILDILLMSKDAFEFAEERRLFYVAITRTKNDVYLVSDSMKSGNGPSPFVMELKQRSHEHIGIFKGKGGDLRHPVLCPRCGTGRLVVRKNSYSGKRFLACTNYPFCEKSYDQIEIIEDKLKCPSCGGWMIRRRRDSDSKPFFGCSNWPECSATYDATEDYKPSYASSSSNYYHARLQSSTSRRNGTSKGSQKNKKTCPECGAPLKLIRNKKDGSRFYGCTRFPTCGYKINADFPSRKSQKCSKKCPRCGAPLKELTNKKDGSVFYGCVRFPKCRYTKNK